MWRHNKDERFFLEPQRPHARALVIIKDLDLCNLAASGLFSRRFPMKTEKKGFLERINGFQRFIGEINGIQQLYQKLSWKKLLFRFFQRIFR